jgi:NAD(P)-dependent dehydrogenase (short-subunit alcohol dehydrogenase family)
MGNLNSNKVVIITGGLGLLGRSFIKALLKENHIAVAADLAINCPEDFLTELKNENLLDNFNYIHLQITNKQSIQEGISNISSQYGRIDALVNNAHPRNANYLRKLEDSDYQDFCDNLSAHVGGFFLCMQQFSLFFKKQGYGNVVSMCSVYGIMAPRFEVYEGADFTMPVEYAAIKSGVLHLTKYFSKYYKGCSIRFNCISPGGVENNQHPEFIKRYNSFGMNKGMLNKEDLHGALLFLISDASVFVNGQNLIVDDGWSL